jgi:glycosyltransferase involved in cell wall biosynthesis
MKFVIFSPMSTASAIGRVTALLADEFVHRGHTVTVVRTEDATLIASRPHACKARLIGWTDDAAVAVAIGEADQLIYQIGDNHPFHCGSLKWLPLAPGIVCLHDFFVANLFWEWARHHPAEARRVLAQWYGPSAPTDFFHASSSEEFLDKASKHYFMTEWICAMAHGVVTHSRWGLDRVARACAGPVQVLPLPYDAPGAVPSALRAEHRAAFINILSVGHANSNKRIESVIRVIGSSELLRERVTYRLCGAIDAQVALALAALARSLCVELTISGQTDGEALQAAFREADIVCCLRWPSLEAGSASAIESLLYGKAVVVTDAGFYAELPDDCVQKISPEREGVELREVLEKLSTDREGRVAMANRAQAWATKTFTATNYVEQLLDVSSRAAAAAPRIRMTRQLIAQLAHWGASGAVVTACNLAHPLDLFQQESGAG